VKQFFVSLSIALFAFMAVPTASAADQASAAEAKSLVKKAIEYMQKNGKDKALAQFNDPKGAFVDRELYVIVFEASGMTLAHGANAKIVGKDLSQMADADGKPILKGLIATAKANGSGWYDYKWPNPVTQSIQHKSTYVEESSGLFFACGIYKN
jgi:cytochrome c